MQQIAEEGGASVFKPVIGSEWIVGVVGVLQFEVMADRIRTEFNIPVAFEPTQYYTARWISSPTKMRWLNLLTPIRQTLRRIMTARRSFWHETPGI